MKLMEAFSGGKKSETSSNKQKIAVVYAVGEITEGKSSPACLGGSTLGSTTMVEAIKKAFDDPKVVAVVLRVDSPGGSATASDLIWHATVAGKKPLVASMGNVAGSGGYYIAMGAKKIFAEPGTITGSIGVLGGKLVTGGLYEKIGMNTEVVSRGKNSGIFTSDSPFTPDERKIWLRHMDRRITSSSARPRRAATWTTTSWKPSPRAASTPAARRRSWAWSTRSARWATRSPRPRSWPALSAERRRRPPRSAGAEVDVRAAFRR